MKPLQQTIRLKAVSGVEGENGSYLATGVRPWLSIEPLSLFKPGGWFRMRYRLGLYDDPARPLVSYRQGAGEIGWHILPGPVLGRADWFDKAPRGATAVWISPVAKKGPFNFAVEEIELLPALDVLRLGWQHGRSRLLSAIGTFILGWHPEADENLRWSISGRDLSAWSEYRSCYSAGASLDGFERPRCNWADAPIVRLYAILDEAAKASEIDATIGSLLGQIYPRWSFTVLGASLSPEVNDKIKSAAARDPRVTALGQGCELAGNDADFVSPLSWGDRLAPHALACFIEASQQATAAQVFYCDEETETEQGPVPVFKPGWSPRLQSGRPYAGRPLLTRLGHARRRVSFSGGWPGHVAFAQSVLRGLKRLEVQHVRRILVRASPGHCGVLAPFLCAPRSTRGLDANLTEMPSVTIVLATRDRPRYLRQTLAGILSVTQYARLDLVIVDNGSTDLQALAELDAAARDPRVCLLRSPGAFNFAALNNFGAKHAQGRILIFLNNDMAIIDPDWVHELALLASEPEAGAVGCKLLYPDGRVQHAGIVAGLGGSAGHFGAGAREEDEGWLGFGQLLRETSAVTGACLAVEREKFFAAGGFDSVHLPVEFNDIDLCLRLEELGFVTLWTPFARLIHFESASRGKGTFRRLRVHASERAYFRERWAERLRDDPYFHPGLSLYRLSPALA